MPNLIIFDCDGTLVDSEHVYNGITAQLLNNIGYGEYTPALCLELFAGQSWSTIRPLLEARHGVAMPEDIVEQFKTLAEESMTHDFVAAPQADEVLAELSPHYQICVGSNGERGNVIKSLTVTDLKKYFIDDHIFTKIQVPKPKPAPDLFHFACAQMGVSEEDTLIIEDSPAGVTAARAAGIPVLGYIGTTHDKEKQAKALKGAGADAILEELIHIRRHLPA